MDVPPDSADSETPPSDLQPGLQTSPSVSAAGLDGRRTQQSRRRPRLTYGLTYRPHLVCLPQGSMDVSSDSADSEAPPSDLQTSPSVSAAGLDGRPAGLGRAGGAAWTGCLICRRWARQHPSRRSARRPCTSDGRRDSVTRPSMAHCPLLQLGPCGQ